ncbi:MAG TPA: SMI1/KNR4 family protein [Chryseolinea sp.]
MNSIEMRLAELSRRSSQIVLYQDFDFDATLKRVGQMPVKFDTQLLSFLRFSNGVSIFDYCFMGFKNNQLGIDIDENVEELKFATDILTDEFVAFMGTSSSDLFGYLLNMVDAHGNHPIAYNNLNEPRKVFVIASSFEGFMHTFLDDVEDMLDRYPNGEFLLEIENENWPRNVEHWLKSDTDLRELYSSGELRKFFKMKGWDFGYGEDVG